MAVTIDQATAVALAKANLLSIFNERDADKRKKAMQEAYEPDVILYEQEMAITGHDAISDVADSLLAEHPDWSFEPASKVFTNHDVVSDAKSKMYHSVEPRSDPCLADNIDLDIRTCQRQ
jgi:hypothetical protein